MRFAPFFQTSPSFSLTHTPGWVKNPVRMDWAPGAVFTTPPGWWHSHHNDGDERAWVLPVQDAGLLTRQRVLDIRFSHALAP